MLFNLGRREDVDVDGLKRLVASIKKCIDSFEPHTQTVGDIEVLSAKDLGGVWFIDQLWERLGIAACVKRLLSKKSYDMPVERALFAMVASRATAPASKLSVEHWVNNEAYVPGLHQVSVHQLYRSMDFLLETDVHLLEDIFFSVATIMNLEVDLIYFDTTSTYFAIDNADDKCDGSDDKCDGSNAGDSLRQYGHSKDHRRDLPQAVIGLAVTKEGIPVRCWVFDGNTPDVSMVEQVKGDLVGWKLGRVISVLDSGFASEENFIKLQSAGGHYIIGEKMRSGKPEVTAALAKKGRFTELRDNLFAKEAIVGEGERRVRYVIVKNPSESKRDEATRQRHINTLNAELEALGELSGKAHTKAVCRLVANRSYGRYLRTLKNGSLAIDKAKIALEKKLDGKYLIRTSDDTLSLEDIVLGYKQLMDVERAFRCLKSELELRPVYHRKSERIRAHVLICWIALLLVRVAELETGRSWFNILRHLKSLKTVTIRDSEKKAQHTTKISREIKSILSECKLKLPPKILHLSQ